jgi:hypothetical protein
MPPYKKYRHIGIFTIRKSGNIVSVFVLCHRTKYGIWLMPRLDWTGNAFGVACSVAGINWGAGCNFNAEVSLEKV